MCQGGKYHIYCVDVSRWNKETRGQAIVRKYFFFDCVLRSSSNLSTIFLRDASLLSLVLECPCQIGYHPPGMRAPCRSKVSEYNQLMQPQKAYPKSQYCKPEPKRRPLRHHEDTTHLLFQSILAWHIFLSRSGQLYVKGFGRNLTTVGCSLFANSLQICPGLISRRS